MCLAPARQVRLTTSNHVLRAVPPQLAAVYARSHDQAVWDTLLACVGGGPLTTTRASSRFLWHPCLQHRGGQA